jgi:2-aminoadipate transaminase
MATALTRPRLISLAAGFTDNASLPVREAKALLGEILGSRKGGQAALQYGTTIGDLQLRRLTGRRLHALDKRLGDPSAFSPDRMIITNGSQQLLYLLTEALCDPGDLVLVEDPTYFVYLGILQSHGIQTRGIRMESDGLDLRHLDETLASLQRRGQLSRLKLLYLVTYYQNPTGITTAFAKKADAVHLLKRYERAAGHPIYLVEDAAYRELRFLGEDVPSALAVPGGSRRVIYAGTYSKPFATGVRVGFGLLPEQAFRPALRIKANHDFGSSNLLQKLLARALTSGQYEAHLETVRRRYLRKSRVMLHAMEEHFPPGLTWQPPAGGMYIWACLPKHLRSGFKSKLFQAALRRQVLYVPGVLCYAKDPTRHRPDRDLRLSFAAATEANLRLGIARLGQALHHLSD